jgi:hypothetical protein
MDATFDLKSKEFTKNLAENEKIVSTVISDDKFIITTEIDESKRGVKNLLLEEMRQRAQND